MSGDATLPPPAVLWAQRNNVVYLTICLEDCENPTLIVNPTHIYFRSIGGIADRKEHEVNIELYKEIIPEQSKTLQTGRTIEMILQKKESGPFWPHLTKLKEKYHWLKINFNKWKEEDDSDIDAENEDNLEELMRSMGDLGTSERPNFENDDTDSDDEKDADDDIPPPLE